MLSDFSRKLLEFGIGAQALDYIRNGMIGPVSRANLNMTYDTSIGNRAPLLSGGSGEGTGGRSGEYVRAYSPDPVLRSARIASRGGLDYKAEGGEVKDYEYGFGPEASGLGQLVSPLMPFRREVIEPYEERFIESADPSQVERVVTPGQYGDVELAMPQAVEAFLNFKGLARDPEARAALQEGIASTPEMIQMLADRFGISSRAALAGEQEVYDPATNQVVGAEESLLAAPMLTAPGTALSVARTAGEGGKVLGIMGGESAPIATKIKRRVDKLRERGLEGEDLWNAQSNQSIKGYYDPNDGKFRVEFDTQQASLVPREKEGKIRYGVGLADFQEQYKLPDILDFPQLFEAYPQLSEVTILPVPFLSNLDGSYDPVTKVMRVKMVEGGSEESRKQDLLSTVLHEVQHAVQTEERFLNGASSQMFAPEGFFEELSEARTAKNSYEKEIRSHLQKSFDSKYVGFDSPVAVLKLDDLGDSAEQVLKRIKQAENASVQERVAFRKEFDEEFGMDVRFAMQDLLRQSDFDEAKVLSAVKDLRPITRLYRDAYLEYAPLVKRENQYRAQYYRVPGEIEARNVEARFKDPDLKQKSPPATAEFGPEETVYPIDPSYRKQHLRIKDQGPPEPVKKAKGGGVETLAPRAKAMFNKPVDIRQGVGSYAKHIRRA